MRQSDFVLNEMHAVSKSTPIKRIDFGKAIRTGNMLEAGYAIKQILTRPQRGSALNDIVAPSSEVQTIMKNKQTIGNHNKESNVYVVNIKKHKLVIKKSKLRSRTLCLAREYVIGELALNRLRNVIPCFVYTLGAFMSPTSGDLYIACEYVSKQTMRQALVSKKISDREWLSTFCQILIALEFAQSECSFTHFDLHGDNVLLKHKSTTYRVPVGAYTYTVNSKIVPVIIDFGYSTAEVNGRTIGSREHRDHGMLDIMMTGADQYKLLSACSTAATDQSTRKVIRNLFKFYKHNPYTNEHNSPDPKTANATYCSHLLYSRASSMTPVDMLDWILTTYSVLDITKESRKLYANLPTNLSVDQCMKLIDKAESDLSNSDPYTSLLARHDLHIVNTLNNSKNIDISERVSSILSNTRLIRENLFAPITKITVPLKAISRIPESYTFETKISDRDRASLEEYMSSISPYMSLLYIARELGELTDMCRQVQQTRQYKTYCRHYNNIIRAIRWSKFCKER